MKFLASAVTVGAAALASAAAVPRAGGAAVVAAPLGIRADDVKFAETWTMEQVNAMLDKSQPDDSMVHPGRNKTLLVGDPDDELFETPAGEGACLNPAVRIEWRSLTDPQRDDYIAAMRCLMQTPSTNPAAFPGSASAYGDLISLHQQLTPAVHNNGHFLVWHRFYLHVFETMLGRCGYAGPQVWWDETADAGRFAQSPIFTPRFFGALTSAAPGQPAPCVTTSGFGAYTSAAPPDSCVARNVDESATANTAQSWVDKCNGAQNYNDFRGCNEFTYHAYGHNGIGAVMANVAISPRDPVFMLHHGFIDRNWKNWQKAGGEARDREVGGPSATGAPVVPSDVLQAYGLVADATVGDVLDTEGGFLCYVYDR